MYKNLVFKGGGVLGIAYAGALKVLEDNGIMTNIEKVAGTSAGAITAALVSMKYTADEVYNIVNGTNFSTFEDGKDIFRIASKYGLYKGDALLAFITKCITDKGLQPTATFADFQAQGFLDLHVFATDLNTQDCTEFSVSETPNTTVAEAIRASMSIPMFFEAWKFSTGIPDNHIYVDGGMVYNYPLTIFDDTNGPNPESLGFYLTDLHDVSPANTLAYDQPFEYIKFLFETMIDAQVVDYKRDPEMQKRTVMIDDLGLSATNFKLSTNDEKNLYDSGIACTKKFLGIA